jgi:hypothetical protein
VAILKPDPWLKIDAEPLQILNRLLTEFSGAAEDINVFQAQQ